MNSEEIEREFGYTKQDLDDMAAEYENGNWPEDGWGPVNKIREPNAQEQAELDRIVEMYECEDAEAERKAGKDHELVSAQ